jgi:hypothetical protein
VIRLLEGGQAGTQLVWYVDRLLGNESEIINETTATAKQQLRIYATVLEPLLDSDSRVTMEVLLVRYEAISLDRPSSVRLVQCSTVQCISVEWSGPSRLVSELEDFCFQAL